jgi:LacI family transcriptional regulator
MTDAVTSLPPQSVTPSVTIVDVAQAAGVSTATVSRTLNATGQVAPATRQRISDAIRVLGYRPNSIARSLAVSATRTLAILLPDITNPFFPALVKGVQLCCERRGYTLLLCNTGGAAPQEERYVDVLIGKRVDGLLLIGFVSGPGLLTELTGRGIGVVVLDREVPLPGVSSVRVDHRAGARAATAHLLELGRRRIAHVTGPADLDVSAHRLQGYRDALAEAGVPFDADLVAEGDFTAEGGHRAVERLLAAGTGLGGLFCGNDVTAIGALSALQVHGLSVPGDVAVVGFDDVSAAAYTVPPLTTVGQPTYEIGRMGAELLIDAIELPDAEPRTVTLQGTLVVRGSTVPAL